MAAVPGNRGARARKLALAGIIGPLLFTALVILQGIRQPTYSHIGMPISVLTAYDTGWIQILNFCVFGTLTAVLAWGLHMGVAPTSRGVAGIALLALGGVGIILAGLFPWVMVNGEPTETPAHVVAAVTSFSATGLGLIVFSRRLAADPDWRSLSGYTLASGIIVLVLFVALGVFAIDDGAPLHAWAGLLQRVLCAVLFTCLIVLAMRLRRPAV